MMRSLFDRRTLTPRAKHFATNRAAAHWRAIIIQAMRKLGLSYAEIGAWFEISPERVRQICARPPPAAQLSLPIAEEQKP